MTDEQWKLLLAMRESQDHGAFAMACDGKNRKLASQLESHGYAEWRGTQYGSSFYSINGAGRKRVDAGRAEAH